MADELIQIRNPTITLETNWCGLNMSKNEMTDRYSFIVTILCQIWQKLFHIDNNFIPPKMAGHI